MKGFKSMLKKINFIFTKKQKKRLALMFIVILIGAFMELVGVAAIIPFMEMILSPGTIEQQRYIGTIYRMLSVQSPKHFIIISAIVLILIYILKNGYIALMYNLQYRFTYNNQRRLSTRILKAYMQQPYLFHVSHNSAELMRNISTDTTMFFQAVLGTLQLMTEICVCGVLGVFLMYTDKTITIGVVTLMILFLLVFLKKFKKQLSISADQSRYYTAGLTKWLQQSFGGIKEIKVLSREKYFKDNYDADYYGFVKSQREYMLFQIIPRPVMEAVCMSGILLVIAFKMYMGVDSKYFITTLSAFAVAAFRMLPSFNRIASNLSIIMFNKASVDAVYEDLKQVENLMEIQQNAPSEERLKYKESIIVKDVCFTYLGTDAEVLCDVNLRIPKNRAVALIGPSGAGKTTLADIILGVLHPTGGSVMVDGIDIFEHLRGWQQNLGYIPQNIYLMDDTIRNNIAFGVPENEIDDEQIKRVIKEAQLDGFIQTLPDRLQTVVGELGVRLSGGQRQRIGIARALYTDPEILVLDEATSALDNDTETAVMEAIEHLSGSKTMIIIAHRLTTIRNCEIVYEVKNGTAILQKTPVESD